MSRCYRTACFKRKKSAAYNTSLKLRDISEYCPCKHPTFVSRKETKLIQQCGKLTQGEKLSPSSIYVGDMSLSILSLAFSPTFTVECLLFWAVIYKRLKRYSLKRTLTIIQRNLNIIDINGKNIIQNCNLRLIWVVNKNGKTAVENVQ